MKRLTIVAGFVILALLASCEKEPQTAQTPEKTEYSLKFGEERHRIFVAGNSAELEIVNTNEYGEPVNVTEDVVCSVYVPANSSELVKEFNAKWASACVEAPSSVYSLDTIKIKAGSSRAVVKLKIDTDKVRSAKSGRAYVLPLRIKTDSGTVRSHDLRFVVLPTYTVNSAGRTVVHFSSADAYLEMYYTDQINDKAMIFCPGGGYSELNNPLPTHYADNGIAVGVLWYTLPVNELRGRYDLPTQDAYDAIDVLWANSSRWGGYTKVGTAGRSAGGHLAATAAAYRRDKVDFQILLYAVINMDISKSHEGSVYQFLGDYPTPALIDAYTIFKQVGPDSPRAFLTWATNDSVVPQEFNCAPMAAALKAAGVPVTTSVNSSAGHATGPDYPGCVLDWLKTF